MAFDFDFDTLSLFERSTPSIEAGDWGEVIALCSVEDPCTYDNDRDRLLDEANTQTLKYMLDGVEGNYAACKPMCTVVKGSPAYWLGLSMLKDSIETNEPIDFEVMENLESDAIDECVEEFISRTDNEDCWLKLTFAQPLLEEVVREVVRRVYDDSANVYVPSNDWDQTRWVAITNIKPFTLDDLPEGGRDAVLKEYPDLSPDETRLCVNRDLYKIAIYKHTNAPRSVQDTDGEDN